MPAHELQVSVTDARIVGIARRLRAVCWALEAGLLLVVGGSALLFGAVHPWAFVPLWCAGFGLSGLMAYRALLVTALREPLGRRRLSFAASDRRITLDMPRSGSEAGWTFDLAAPLLPATPLFLPGLLFIGWVLIQLLPSPPELVAWLGPRGNALSTSPTDRWRPLTVAVPDTLRGLAFLVNALLLHLVAAVTLQRKEACRRFLRGVAGLAVLLATVGLVQFASGTRRIYGFFEPIEGGDSIFGPFVNRNHFAGYMILVTPLTLAGLARAYRRYAWRVGERPNLRRRIVDLQTPEGTALAYASMAALAALAALLATASRGALLAFGFGLGVAALGLRGRGGAQLRLPIAVFAAIVLAWFAMALGSPGIERIPERFAEAPSDSLRRTVVWKDALERMQGLWLTGSGFNTFAVSMSRASPWALPLGATRWPEGGDPSKTLGPRGGFRTPAGLPGLPWYREAHNDYLQVFVETGLPGLLLALWAAFAALRAGSVAPWLQAAFAGLLLHEFVDFDLQIPAIAVLFVAMAAMPPGGRQEETRRSEGRTLSSSEGAACEPRPASARGSAAPACS